LGKVGGVLFIAVLCLVFVWATAPALVEGYFRSADALQRRKLVLAQRVLGSVFVLGAAVAILAR
jgi:hypothetical protein